jgi:hypothetical protein
MFKDDIMYDVPGYLLLFYRFQLAGIETTRVNPVALKTLFNPLTLLNMAAGT